MSNAYSVTDYLLDRANIHDTVSRLPWYYDARDREGLVREVFAPDVFVDFTRVLSGGGEPSTLKSGDWARQVIGMVEHFDSSQHIYGSLIPELPQPTTPTATRPNKVKVLSQGGASMVRAAAEGGPLLQNGGQIILELVRLPGLEAEGLNPWRVSSMIVMPAWVSGNQRVMDGIH